MLHDNSLCFNRKNDCSRTLELGLQEGVKEKESEKWKIGEGERKDGIYIMGKIYHRLLSW